MNHRNRGQRRLGHERNVRGEKQAAGHVGRADSEQIAHPRIPRQQGRPAQQAMRGLRPADDLAPPLGAHLGRGEVLLRRLPARQGCAWLNCATTLYWDFLTRHEALLAASPRMALQVKNVARLNDA